MAALQYPISPVSRSGKVMLGSLFAAWLGATGGAIKVQEEMGSLSGTKSDLRTYHQADADVTAMFQSSAPLTYRVANNNVTLLALQVCPERKPACLINYSEQWVKPALKDLKVLQATQTEALRHNMFGWGGAGLLVGAAVSGALTRRRKPVAPSA